MTKRDKFQGRVEDGVDRPCNWPECESAGVFRAPLPRDSEEARPAQPLEALLDDRVDNSAWFCLDHVREYNADWDYFDGMSEAAINAFRDEDACWHRPTWSSSAPDAGVGAGAKQGAGQPWTGTGRFADSHGLFTGAGANGETAKDFNRPLDLRDLQALYVLGLEEGARVADIKASYKRLAKQHHPDLNGGDAESGERLRAVIEAYNRLSEAFQDC
jgi:hypothetical protein